MNSKNDLILKYIDGNMDEKERIRFETELKNSITLQQEVSSYRNVYNEFSTYNQIHADNDYFSNMVPRFRSKLPGKLKRFPLRQVAFASMASLIVVMFLFLVLRRSDQVPNIANSLNEHELTNLVDRFSSDILPFEFFSDVTIDSTISALYLTELNITPETESYYFADRKTDVNTIVQDINDEEADNIYNEIINKKYF
jgi:hypothetical protein